MEARDAALGFYLLHGATRRASHACQIRFFQAELHLFSSLSLVPEVHPTDGSGHEGITCRSGS